MLIPLIYRFILFPGRYIYRFIFRPKTAGVKVFVLNKDEVVLIKNTYGKINHWTVPGGGINKNESLANAAKREVFEEVGIVLETVKKVGIYQDKQDKKHIFIGTTKTKQLKIDPHEIKEAKWFNRNNLPHKKTKTLKYILKFL